ncbi:MAG: ATP-binding protein [Lachnospiraceae bacterium]|nr:ATP-binding protein [Lachnospiraceae bacterium]
MEYGNFTEIMETSDRRIRETSLTYIRPMMRQIDWRDRLICIKGGRGTGKTTLMLQHIRQTFSGGEALYVSLDNLWFETHSLTDVVTYHVENGGTHLFMDEVHYLDHWQTLVKNLNDNFQKLSVVYSGSSALKIESAGGDLSRRQVQYHMPGLSFREYLALEEGLTQEAFSLESLLRDHVSLAEEISAKTKVLPAFRRYLRKGYYPFYKEVFGGYEDRIVQVINQVLESDYPAVEPVTYATVQKIRKMLMILAENAPQTPNMQRLYEQLETDRNQGLKMLYALERAELLHLLSSESASLKNMSRPQKIYCNNTNMMHALVHNANVGCERETFFLNQLLAAGHSAHYPKEGDFLIDGRYLFEVGGRNKSFEQIKDLPDSFLAVDDTEIGRGNRIPLWMFGFLY